MKKTLMILCGLIMSLSAFAQTSVTKFQYHMFENKSSIIREARYPATIICVNTKDNSVLFIYDDGSSYTKIRLLSGFKINDMVIPSGDTVFFCGETIEEVPKGLIGFFDIDDVFNNNGNIFIQNYLISGQNLYRVSTLTRMDSYTDKNFTRHVVCVGRCENYYPCLVDYTFDYFGGGYLSGCIHNSKETLSDVKTATQSIYDNLCLISAGFDSTYIGRYIGLRMYLPDDVFSLLNPMQDTLRLLSAEPSITREWYDEGLLLSRVNRNYFSTISYRHANTTSSDYYNANLQVAIYDINKILTGAYSIMSKNIELPMLNSYNRSIKDVAYSIRKDRLAFITDINFLPSNIYKNLCFEFNSNSLPSSGLVKAYDYNNIVYDRLSAYQLSDCYVLSGREKSSNTIFRYGMETYGIDRRCPTKEEYPYVLRDLTEIYKILRPFDMIGGVRLFQEFIPDKLERDIHVDCTTFEE